MDILPTSAKNKFTVISQKFFAVFAQLAICKSVVLMETIGTVQILFI